MIEFEGVSKRFPGVAALGDVSFTVRRGECHALLGENGAGKSTLGKILAGLYRPDGGRILLAGRETRFHSARDAIGAGVGIVHQELAFCPNLSVAENLCLHDLPRRGLQLDRRELRRRAESLLSQIGLTVDVDQPLSGLSIGQEQMVQIAAAVGLGAKVLVFDEPTSSLGKAEVQRLFGLIRRLQAEGVTILYVSHRLEEIFELCQSLTVLRDGRHVATRPIAEVDRDELVRLMVGRNVASFEASSAQPEFGSVRLRLRELGSPGRFSGIDLDVCAGEVVGLAGLVGAGRTEIAEAVAGLDSGYSGRIEIDGRPVQMGSPRDAQSLGIGLIPEDRKRHGLVLGMNVRENVTLSILDRFRRWAGRADRRAESHFAQDACRRLAVRTPDVETAINSLSGGNQQKVMFARGLAADCKILLIDEPTRGVDVGAKREIHELIAELAAQQVAVLLVSSDLPELLALSHRVIVLREGRIVAELTRSQADPETVVRHMTGLAASPA
ncbi:MAG: sugar ABC transporter ATP-binding protein [Planctomycetaceae bacterium]|nr:sugar ABC transporter ATP-binding protein [Planctomycetaceae bacterium]